jgi:hypothetical protein
MPRRFPRWVLGLTLSIPRAAALGCCALALSCGFSAVINIDLDEYDRTEFLTSQHCEGDNNTVDLLYHLFTETEDLISDRNPILAGRRAAGVKVELLEDFTVEGQGTRIAGEIVADSNQFVQLSEPGRPRAMALLMDNSRSLDGFDENTNTRFNPPLVTDSGDQRISGAKTFLTDVDTFLPGSDKATIIAFHGDGTGGVIPKMRSRDDEPPSIAWFTSNRATFDAKLNELKNEENGKTPLFDAVSFGVNVLKTVYPATNVQKVAIAFLDGPDNSSEGSLDSASAALRDNRIPLLGIGLAPKLEGGAQQLRDLACATSPRGAVLIAPTSQDLVSRFRQMRHLVAGYWRVQVRLQQPVGLAAGTYTVTGKMAADPLLSPKNCDSGAAQPCPTGMECDAGSNRCFVRVSFPYSTN